MTVLNELKAHFGDLAKSKRDTAQRLHAQLGEDRISYITASDQKPLIKLLKDADKRLGENLEPFMSTTQVTLEKKLAKLRVNLKKDATHIYPR